MMYGQDVRRNAGFHIDEERMIAAILDGDPPLADEEERHLESCAACAGQARSLRRLESVLAQARALERSQARSPVPPALRSDNLPRGMPGLRLSWALGGLLAVGLAAFFVPRIAPIGNHGVSMERSDRSSPIEARIVAALAAAPDSALVKVRATLTERLRTISGERDPLQGIDLTALSDEERIALQGILIDRITAQASTPESRKRG